MNSAVAIQAMLQHATPGAGSTFLHLGAGSGAVLSQYGQLSPSKVVLVEGDPLTADALKRRARRFPWAQVVAEAATTGCTNLHWYRYNVPVLNGPIEADSLGTHYPRLRRQGVASVPGTPLSLLLREVHAGARSTEKVGLLLDIPGQEGALLESLGSTLAELSIVVLRRCTLTLPGAAGWPELQELMARHSFEPLGQEVDDGPLWRIATFGPNPHRREIAKLRLEVDELAATLSRRDAELLELQDAAENRTPPAQPDQTVGNAEVLAALGSFREHLERLIQRESLNVIKQLEAYDAVRSALGTEVDLPEFHGWPVSADFAAHLLKLLRTRQFDMIIEFGSGTSTVVIAATLARQSTASSDRQKVPQVAFEHSPDHLAATRRHLQALQADAGDIVREALLVPYQLSSGAVAPYYDCSSVLEAMRAGHPAPRSILVLVDGPPAATAPHARYPALECVLGAFPTSGLCILLDDFRRAEEKETVERWKADLVRIGRSFSATTLAFEKGACQVDVEAL